LFDALKGVVSAAVALSVFLATVVAGETAGSVIFLVLAAGFFFGAASLLLPSPVVEDNGDCGKERGIGEVECTLVALNVSACFDFLVGGSPSLLALPGDAGFDAGIGAILGRWMGIGTENGSTGG
jgi:hypothetical protein